MKRILFIGVILFSLLSCNSKQGSMQVQVEVQGLKKGTVYLQKVADTLMISVDSVTVNGTDKLTLSDEITSPEMYYISMANFDKKILFFGEKGIIKISTKLDKFDIAAKITGSKNQKLLDQYHKIITKFNHQQLDLIEANFKAQKARDQKVLDSIDKVSKRLIKRRYLYATNFAVTHPKSEVSAYIALADLYNANITLLDTINNSLSKKVKASKYGKQLAKFIADIKKEEE
ncbi:MAG: DUF4369 domain-containing protein [Flavobacteriaceae bacterium]|nr:DUF4369 domain-containing protein [Flavobacteriaceae bacterium]